MSTLKGAAFAVGWVALIAGGAAFIADSGVVLYHKHLENVAILTKEVVINSQPCTLPTSTNNEVTQ